MLFCANTHNAPYVLEIIDGGRTSGYYALPADNFDAIFYSYYDFSDSSLFIFRRFKIIDLIKKRYVETYDEVRNAISYYMSHVEFDSYAKTCYIDNPYPHINKHTDYSVASQSYFKRSIYNIDDRIVRMLPIDVLSVILKHAFLKNVNENIKKELTSCHGFKTLPKDFQLYILLESDNDYKNFNEDILNYFKHEI